MDWDWQSLTEVEKFAALQHHFKALWVRHLWSRDVQGPSRGPAHETAVGSAGAQDKHRNAGNHPGSGRACPGFPPTDGVFSKSGPSKSHNRLEKNSPSEFPFWFHFWVKMFTTSPPPPHLDLLQPSLALQFCLARTALHSKLAMNFGNTCSPQYTFGDGSHCLYPWSMLWMYIPVTGVNVLDVFKTAKRKNAQEHLHRNRVPHAGSLFELFADSTYS